MIELSKNEIEWVSGSGPSGMSNDEMWMMIAALGGSALVVPCIIGLAVATISYVLYKNL